MPIQVASFIIPKNGEKFYILEDKFIKGGLQSVSTSVEMEAILPENRKAGMLVVLQDNMTLWQLSNDLVTWTNLQLGGIEGPAGPTGERGEVGPSIYDVWLEQGNVGTETDFLATLQGVQGEVGPAGAQGEQGIIGNSAYQVWLDAGNVGDEIVFLESLGGKSAYQVWLDEGNVGTIANFFESLVGASAYQAWLDEGNVGDVQQFLATLRGDSAYKLWNDLGNVGTEEEFLASLKGVDGVSLQVNAAGTLAERDGYQTEGIGFVYLDEENSNLYVLKSLNAPYWSEPIPFSINGVQGEQGIQGIQGIDGKSAYQVWIDAGNVGTEADFFFSLRGDTGPEGPQGEIGPIGETGLQGEQGIQGIQGEVGPQGIQGIQGETGLQGPIGDSAYQAWIAAGNVGDEAAFILSIKGEKGDTGDTGPQGIQGETGLQGPIGETGLQGIQGEVGPQGIQGIQGEVGPQGIQGIQGETGPAGESFNGSHVGNMTVDGSVSYKNIFASTAAFPDATIYEGMFVVADDTNKAYFSSDGSWIELESANARVIPYDISFFVPGTMPTASELVGAVVCARTIAISLNAPGSIAKAAVAPAASISYALNVNGVAKGTVNFAAGSANGTFTLAQNLTLVAGDVVELVTPGTIDASIKDVVITIVGRASAPQLSMSF